MHSVSLVALGPGLLFFLPGEGGGKGDGGEDLRFTKYV